MRNFKLMAIALFGLVVFACGSKSENKSENTTTVSKNDMVEVIDFHSTHRCVTCKSIESNAKLTLETYFQKELKEGKVSFKVINVDDEQNYAIAE